MKRLTFALALLFSLATSAQAQWISPPPGCTGACAMSSLALGAGSSSAPSLTLGNAGVGLYGVSSTGFGIIANGITPIFDYNIRNANSFTMQNSGLYVSTIFGGAGSGSAVFTADSGGKALSVITANVSAANSAAGNVNITGGNATGTGASSNGGSVVLIPGTSTNGTAGTIQLAGLTTGTNADFVCLGAGNVVLIQSSACTISSARFKINIKPLRENAVSELAKLTPVSFNMKPSMKNADAANYWRTQIGLTAENVAAVDPRMAIYEPDGKTPKSYRQEAVIALLVKAVQQQQGEIADMKSCRLRVMGRCWW